MTILVLGGSGFVGHAIVRALRHGGYVVAVLNRGSRAVDGVDQLVADRRDRDAFARAIGDRRFDAVVDTNCYTPREAQITRDALAGRMDRLAMISTAAVYRGTRDAAPDENAPTGGSPAWGDYGRAKSKAEAVYAKAGPPLGKVACFRPPYIFGPGNNIDRERWFFGRLVHARPVLIPGDGMTRMQLVHEDDLGAAVVAWLSRDQAQTFETFNVADPQIVTFRGFVALLASASGLADTAVALGAAGLPSRASWFPYEGTDLLVATAKAHRHLDWAPALGLAERFGRTFAALREAGALRRDDWTLSEEEAWRGGGDAIGAAKL